MAGSCLFLIKREKKEMNMRIPRTPPHTLIVDCILIVTLCILREHEENTEYLYLLWMEIWKLYHFITAPGRNTPICLSPSRANNAHKH